MFQFEHIIGTLFLLAPVLNSDQQNGMLLADYTLLNGKYRLSTRGSQSLSIALPLTSCVHRRISSKVREGEVLKLCQNGNLEIICCLLCGHSYHLHFELRKPRDNPLYRWAQYFIKNCLLFYGKLRGADVVLYIIINEFEQYCYDVYNLQHCRNTVLSLWIIAVSKIYKNACE
ncbi:Hypothetical_protein [Hexamita inflata]|uniref:Hypothetical_protein n=1 Tax=Hexamita inflata TaxID=28002 RepID=A0AA86QIN5_9EUKA|nr:Hypothetical protein HINF_LOCUS42923 [Hexamita inflata]